MKRVKINLYVYVMYNQFTKEQREADYNIIERIDSNYTLQEALDFIYKKYEIILTNKEKKNKIWFIEDYIFKNYERIEMEYNIKELLNTKLEILQQFFNINRRKLIIYYVSGIGATTGVADGMKFFFHPNEDQHHRRHIHVSYQGEEIRIDLDTFRIMNKPFTNKKKNKKAIKYVERNADMLRKTWDKFVKNGLPFDFKMVI